MAKKAKPKVKPYRAHRYGILNPWGDVWSPETFGTVDQAMAYITSWWGPRPKTELSKFKVVPVRVTVSMIG